MAPKRTADDPPDSLDRPTKVPRANNDEAVRSWDHLFNEAQADTIAEFCQLYHETIEAKRQGPHRLLIFNTTLSGLLTEVVKRDPPLESIYADLVVAKSLVTPPDSMLYPLLVQAASNGQWSSVRGFAALQKTQSRREAGRGIMGSDADNEASERAWKIPFNGSHHILMLDILNDMNLNRERGEAYANFVPIIQSSGTGKSRVVDELSGLVFTLPFCLRQHEGGYPPADPGVGAWFMRRRHNQNRIRAEHSMFFVVLFRLVARRVQKLHVSQNTTLTKEWRKYLAEQGRKNRQELYQEVIETAGNIMEGWGTPTGLNVATLFHDIDADSSTRHIFDNTIASLVQYSHVEPPSEAQKRETGGTAEGAAEENMSFPPKLGLGNATASSMSAASSASTDSSESNEGQRKRDDTVVKFIDSLARAAASLLINIIEEQTAFRKPKDMRIFLYIDEAHALFHKNEQNSGLQPYHVFCMTLDSLRDEEIFTVLLSTASHLAQLSPAHHVWFSDRTRNRSIDHVQAPITELPFDNYGKVIIVENCTSLENACRPEVMVRFGRPLWWTRWKDGGADVQRDMFKYAQKKLAAAAPTHGLKDLSEEAKLAILGVRVLLNFEPNRIAAVELENRLVQGYMRIAYSVPQHREYLRSGVPSEPVLAEAAAIWMNRDLHLWPRFLATVVRRELIEKGQAGELAARLILTLAHDVAVRQVRTKTKPSWTSTADQKILPGLQLAEWDVPIPLQDFLIAWVGQEHADKIWDSFPDNAPKADSKRFKEVFKDARVRFSHFVQAHDATIVTDDAMWAALSRGMAFQCARNQQAIDTVLPVLLWSESLGRFVVTAMFLQFKNRLDEVRPEIGAEALHFFTPTEDERASTRPYITVVMNLGVGRPQTSPARNLASLKKREVPQGPPALPYEAQRSSTMSSSPADRAETPSAFYRGKHATPVRVQQGREAKPVSRTPTHPRYSFVINGCSPSVYPNVVREEDKDVFALLLGRREIIDEHPRQTEHALVSVLQLKHSWSSNMHSFHWVGKMAGEASGRLPRPGFEEWSVTGFDPTGAPILQEEYHAERQQERQKNSVCYLDDDEELAGSFQVVPFTGTDGFEIEEGRETHSQIASPQDTVQTE